MDQSLDVEEWIINRHDKWVESCEPLGVKTECIESIKICCKIKGARGGNRGWPCPGLVRYNRYYRYYRQ